MLVSILLLTGCGQLKPNVEAERRYQLVGAGNGNVWRLDTITGETSLCSLSLADRGNEFADLVPNDKPRCTDVVGHRTANNPPAKP
jgi:hypothetical protein